MELLLLLLIIAALLGSRFARGCLLGIFWFIVLVVAFILFLAVLIQSDVKDNDRPAKPRTEIVLKEGS
ncbi:MAG: hypothetical protein WD603_00995 [Patescibacteria group bacterium]